MNILLFGITRDIVGQASLTIPDREAGRLKTVASLKRYLRETYPGLDAVSTLAVAVNKDYAAEETVIEPMDEIALIPPVSGG